MNSYYALIEACQTIKQAKLELTGEEGSYVSPAWRMLHHAQLHLEKLRLGMEDDKFSQGWPEDLRDELS